MAASQHVILAVCCSIGALASEGGASPNEAGLTPAHAGWETVWFDDFEGNALDPSKWAPEVSCWGGGNDERQCYTDRAANIRVEDGMLRLIARAEAYTGPLYPPEQAGKDGETASQAYTSGKIRTRGLASWTYGRISARMKLPAGQGTWPAFWMMPADPVYGEWPLSGELDIMEAANLETPCGDCPGGVERRSSGALHFGGRPPDNTYSYHTTPGTRVPGPSREWRTYSVEWAQGVIRWRVDGDIFLRLDSDDWYTASPNAEARVHAPFDQPFYLMLNLAVGGNLPEKSNGGGFDPAAFPAELQVDWVKVEQCSQDRAAGRRCLSDQAWNGTPKGPWEVEAR